MALPPPDPTSRKYNPPSRQTKRKPPVVKPEWDTKTPPSVPMPGPNRPDPADTGNGVLGKGGTKSGAYFVPGLGQWAEAKNNQRYRNRHAFNPGQSNGRRSS